MLSGSGLEDSVQEEGEFRLSPSSTIMVLGWLSVSMVINFRLGLVITPKRASALEVVVCSACTLTTSMVGVAGCVKGSCLMVVSSFMFGGNVGFSELD